MKTFLQRADWAWAWVIGDFFVSSRPITRTEFVMKQDTLFFHFYHFYKLILKCF